MKRALTWLIVLIVTGFWLGMTGLKVHLPEDGRFNIVGPTMGGMQIWTDTHLAGDWRIQVNSVTGHCRVLDDENDRQAWGRNGFCLTALNEQAGEAQANPASLTLMIHGIGGHPKTFNTMKASLEAEGIKSTHWNYASTRYSIEKHAEHLNALLSSLDGVSEISFVTHSMGGLVLRAALADGQAPWRQNIHVIGAVMIAPPNGGAEMAERVAHSGLFEWATTDAGQNLRPSFVQNLPGLDIPNCIVAARLEGEGSPYISGPDDGLVGVAETALDGKKADLVIESDHISVTSDPETLEFTAGCLNRFRSLAATTAETNAETLDQ